jgi:hypothetical protein
LFTHDFLLDRGLGFEPMVIRMNGLTALAPVDPSFPGSEGSAQADRARELVMRLSAIRRRSTAEMLLELRRAFPDAPLAVRVRALDALRRG